MDIAQNSIVAGARLLEIDVLISHARNVIELVFTDDGRGMSPEMTATVAEPFTTTRKTRKVGLGLPFLKMTALMTGGDFSIESELGKGTKVSVSFGLDHIDRPPLGDLPGALFSLVAMNPQMDFLFVCEYDGARFEFDTRVIRETIAPLPIDNMEILSWIKECMYTEINELHGGRFQ